MDLFKVFSKFQRIFKTYIKQHCFTSSFIASGNEMALVQSARPPTTTIRVRIPLMTVNLLL